MVDVIESLRRHFGHASIRSGQEGLVRAVVDSRDVLAVMPTGSGLSPVIALMKDQVDDLTQRGIRAAAPHSLLSAEARRADGRPERPR
jgi:ATP-dependent DNA helicase RecQ